MKNLTNQEEEIANQFMEEAVKIAMNSTCERAKCGSVIVKNGGVIGRGFNSPPNNLEEQRKCKNNKKYYVKVFP